MSNQEQETAKAYTPTTEEIRNGWARSFEFDRWLALHDRVVAAKALEDAADEIQFVRVSRIERRSVQWWDGMDDAEQIICARAAALRVQGETKP